MVFRKDWSDLRRANGLALVLVLWVLSLLSIIATGFVFSTRTNTTLSSNLISMARAEALADAGVHRAFYELQIPGVQTDSWKADGRPHLWEFQDGVILVVVSDESAKIDINTANNELLKALFRYAGLDEQGGVALLDAVLDWRDEDSLRRPQGAEAEDYAAAGLAYTPTNGRFRSIGELRQVLGMTNDLYRRMAGLITVYSDKPGFNSAIAAREMLLLLPGADPVQVDAFIAAREVIPAGMPKPIFPLAQPFHSDDSKVYSVRAEARLADKTIFIREAVVRLSTLPGHQITYLAWRAPSASRQEDAEELLSPKAQNGK
jgi:general secretion pathway protein K